MNGTSDNRVRLDRLVALFRHRGSWLAAVLLILLGIAFAGYRAHQRYAVPAAEFDFSKSGMSDFHNGVYFPAMAFREGINPYSEAATRNYPMARSAPPYSPVVFLLYLPLTWLELPAADIVFFALNVVLLVVTAGLIVSMVRAGVGHQEFQPAGFSLLARLNRDHLVIAWLAGFLLVSRPGHITLFTGYFTLQLVLGTLLAFHFSKSRPWLSGLGMLLASGKPTYIIPLIILMAARKDYRALLIGFVMCSVVATAGLGWLASHSDIPSVIEGIRQGQEAFDDDPTEDPKNTWTRLDTMGVIAKVAAIKPSGLQYLLGMLVILAPICWFIWRYVDDESESGGAGLTASIAILGLLVSIYHHSYDGLAAASVWCAVVLGGTRLFPGLSPAKLWIAGLLLTVPAINYLATLRFREWAGFNNQDIAWHVVTSANGVCLLVALLILMTAAWPDETDATP